jgi:RNA polymerase sigma-70 factor (ECF subfamily)
MAFAADLPRIEMMSETPASLLDRLRVSANQEAWQHFVSLYTPLLFQWARRVGLDATDAADLVQDVLLLLVRKLPEFRYQPGKRFRGWLWTVLVNKYRENLRRAAPASMVGGDEAHLSNVPATDNLTEISEAEYREHVVREALKLMEREFQPKTWQACWSSVMEGKTAETVAAELGMTAGAVRAAKFRVLSRLRSELKGLLDY